MSFTPREGLQAMTEAKKYWVADAEGVKALVSGAEAHNLWTAGRGWTDTTEPAGQEFVWLQHNEHGGRGKFAAQAVPLWEGRGWLPSDPPEPENAATAHWPAEGAPVEAKPQTTATMKPAANANSGDKKE
jgi:hypothetical protein